MIDPVEFLSSRKSVARYGDGEWLAIFGAMGRNIDKCEHRLATKPLRECLQATDETICALQPHAKRTLMHKIKPWLAAHAPHRGLDWPSADYMVDMVKAGRMAAFTTELLKHYVLMIGPSHHAELKLHNAFVAVPERNAVTDVDRIVVEAESKPADVVLISAGYAGTVLAHRLGGRGATVMDVGSIWDPYVGKASRGVWTKMLKDRSLPPLR